jgi:hypothetical protein
VLFPQLPQLTTRNLVERAVTREHEQRATSESERPAAASYSGHPRARVMGFTGRGHFMGSTDDRSPNPELCAPNREFSHQYARARHGVHGCLGIVSTTRHAALEPGWVAHAAHRVSPAAAVASSMADAPRDRERRTGWLAWPLHPARERDHSPETWWAGSRARRASLCHYVASQKTRNLTQDVSRIDGHVASEACRSAASRCGTRSRRARAETSFVALTRTRVMGFTDRRSRIELRVRQRSV